MNAATNDKLQMQPTVFTPAQNTAELAVWQKVGTDPNVSPSIDAPAPRPWWFWQIEGSRHETIRAFLAELHEAFRSGTPSS